MSEHKICAIVLAAGSGKRMHSDTKKQFIMLDNKPVLYYPLKAFENSIVNEIILVCAKEDIDFCRDEIVSEYGFKKVTKIVSGGAERYDSVYNGLKSIDECDYVMIHDGARPFVTCDIINRAYEDLKVYKSAVCAMPVKDTIKIADSDGFVKATPNRESVYMMQTPQCFEYKLIYDAYCRLSDSIDELKNNGVIITDDAMVAEQFTDLKVKLTLGSYNNIKITTNDDLILAESILKSLNS